MTLGAYYHSVRSVWRGVSEAQHGAYTSNSFGRLRLEGYCEFETILDYRVSSRPTLAIEWNTVSLGKKSNWSLLLVSTPFPHLVQQAARATIQAHRCLSGLQLALACPVFTLTILLASLGQALPT